MVALVIFGLLAFASTGECVITGWTTPLLASGADIDGGIEYVNEGATGTIYTFLAITGATSITGYTIDATTPVVFAVGATTGLLTVTTGVLDGAASTLSYVLKVTATDDTSAVGTATLTISILPAQFSYGFLCAYIMPAASGGNVITNALSSVGTNTIAIASGNTNTDFTVTATGGVVTTANAITTTSGTSGGYTLVITGVDAVGTFSTATSTVSVCVRGTDCTCSLSSSGATHITAGLLGMFAAMIMMLLK